MPKEKPKILIIEEDRFLRKIYKNKFVKAGFEFREAISGDEGLNKVYSEKPDLILLDLMLPKRSGFDILVELKRNKATKKIPVIILSDAALAQMREELIIPMKSKIQIIERSKLNNNIKESQSIQAGKACGINVLELSHIEEATLWKQGG